MTAIGEWSYITNLRYVNYIKVKPADVDILKYMFYNIFFYLFCNLKNSIFAVR